MAHAIEVQLGANIEKYKAGMDAAKRTGTESLGFIASIFDKIKTMFAGLWDSFKSFFSGFGDKSKSTFDSMSSSASSAFQKLSGHFSGLNSDLDKTSGKMSETEEKTSSLTSKIGTGLVAAFLAVTAVASVMVAKGLLVDSTYAGIATSTDIAVSQISRFEAAAARSGVGIKDLGSSMAKFREEMNKAAAGDGSDEFTKLGVKVADSNNALLKTDDVLVSVAKKIAGMSSETEKYAAAAKIGFDGKAQVLEDIAHASDLSARVTDDQAEATARLGKIWHEILPSGRSMWQEIGDKLTNALTPAMTTASVAILDFKNRIVSAFDQIYGSGSMFDKLATKIQGWSQDASKWFAGVTKSATDMTVSLMQYIALKTGFGDPTKSGNIGYIPAVTPLNSDKKDPVAKDADKATKDQYEQFTKTIKERIAAQQLEAQTGAALTEGQRMALPILTALRDGTLTLSDDQKRAAAEQINSLIGLEQANKQMLDGRAAAEAAAKKEGEAYAALMATIQDKIDQDKLQLAINDNLTDGQKLLIKLDADLASGKLKLTAAHIAAAKAKIQELTVDDQLVKAQKAQQEISKYIDESTVARGKQNAALELEYAMYGKTSDARAIAMVAVDAETWKEQELAKLRADKLPISDEVIARLNKERDARVQVGQATLSQTQALQHAAELAAENKQFVVDAIIDDKQRAAAQLALDSQVWKEKIRNAGDGTEAQKVLQQNFDVWYRNQSIKPALDEQKQLWSSIENTAHDTFVSIFDSGKSAFDRLRDALKNGLLELLYQMTLKKWIISIQSTTSTSAMPQALTGGTGDMFASTASASSNPLISAVGTASSLYKSISGGMASFGSSIASTLGSGVASLGNTFGSSALTTFGQGMQGFGLDGSLGGMSGAGLSAGSGIAAGASILGGVAGGIFGGRAISGGYGGNGAVNTGTAIGAAIGSIIPVIGTALGALIGGLAGGLYNRTFGHKAPEIESQGLKGAYDGTSVTGQTYQNIVEKGGWFASDRHSTDTQALTAEMQSQLVQAFTAIKDSAGTAASALGVSASTLDTYSKTFDITLTGDATKDQDAITKFFAGVSDDVATMLVPNLAAFSQSGETATATLTRLVSEFQATTTAAQNLGTTAAAMFGGGIDSAAARERLVQLAGGTNALTALTASFAQNFLTDAEKIAPVTKAMDAAFTSLGVAIPQTTEQYKALVQSIDPTTEAGAKLLVGVLQLGDAFNTVHPNKAAAILQERQSLQDKLDSLTMTSAQLQAKERAALDASNLALYDQVQALQAQKDAIQASKDVATGLLGDVDNAFTVLQHATQATTDALNKRISSEQALSDAVKSTLSSTMSTIGGLDRAAAQAQIKTALAIAKAGGPLPNADSLKDAFAVVSKDASGQFATREAYLKDLYSTQSDLSALGDLADSSLSVDQQQLNSLNSMLDAAQQQVNLLKGIDTTGLTIAQALAGFHTAVGSAQANPIVAANSGISGLYQSLLGRAPDAAGLTYWENAAANGMSLDQISAYMKSSSEYKHLQGVPGFARGGDHAGGLRWVGEIGPEMEATGASRIHSTQSLIDAMRNPSSNADVLAGAVDRLNATVERQNTIIDGQSKTIEQVRRESKRQADFIERLTNGGKYMPTKEVANGVI